MDLRPTPEQDALRELVRDVATKISPPDRIADTVRGLRESSPSIWTQLAGLGMIAPRTPETLGGAGLGYAEDVILMEEAGSALLPAPLLSNSAHVLPLLLACGEADTLAPAAIAGDRRFAYAGTPVGARTMFEHRDDLVVDWSPDAPRISGTRTWVFGAWQAHHLLVPLVRDDRTCVLVVDAAHATLSEGAALDETVPWCDAEFDGAPAQLILSGHTARAALESAHLVSMLLASAQAVGMIRRLLALTCEYTTTRIQFDRPVAAYQGVSHQLADMYMNLELARSLVLWAALESDRLGLPAETEIVAAASEVLPAAVRAAETAIQLHGGIGMTWESVVHRYYKRALMLRAMHPDASELHGRLAARLLHDPATAGTSDPVPERGKL
jgi:alkylation response protein AidB-like acyl-CoA dehydrogenase